MGNSKNFYEWLSNEYDYPIEFDRFETLSPYIQNTIRLDFFESYGVIGDVVAYFKKNKPYFVYYTGQYSEQSKPYQCRKECLNELIKELRQSNEQSLYNV